MIFAKPGGSITVLLQDFADTGAVLADDRVVTRKTGGHLADDAEAHRVMVATRDERRPCRRAECSGVELRVTQPRLGDAIHRGRGNNAAEGARYAVTLVIGHDEEHVRGTFGRDHRDRKSVV